MFRAPCAQRQEGKNCILHPLVSSHSVGGRPVYRTATYRCDDTRDSIIQFCPPNDEHMCWKHVEAWNKLIIKFSASSWLILRNKLNCLVAVRSAHQLLPVRRHIVAPYRLLKHVTSVFIHTDCLNTQCIYSPRLLKQIISLFIHTGSLNTLISVCIHTDCLNT